MFLISTGTFSNENSLCVAGGEVVGEKVFHVSIEKHC